MSVNRLKFKAGDLVKCQGHDLSTVLTVVRVEPALERPYFLSDNEFYGEDKLTIVVPPARTWEDFEADFKHMMQQARERFAARDATEMHVEVQVNGPVHGDLKIKYTVGTDRYDNDKTTSYSFEPAIEELFRRKGWNKRNTPEALTYVGDKDKDGSF